MSLDPLSSCVAVSTSYVDTTVTTQAGQPVIGGVTINSGSYFVIANQNTLTGVRPFFSTEGIWLLTYAWDGAIASSMLWTQIDSVDALGVLFVALSLAAKSFQAYPTGSLGAHVYIDQSGENTSRQDGVPTISLYEESITQDTHRANGSEWIETEIHECVASLWAPSRGILRMLRSFFITQGKSACGNNIFRALDGSVTPRAFESYGSEVKLKFQITSQLPRYKSGVGHHTALYTNINTTDTPGDIYLGNPNPPS